MIHELYLAPELWMDADTPGVEGADRGVASCAMCGLTVRASVPAKAAFGVGFSGYADLADMTSNRVCEACVWVMRGKPPATWRLWTVVYRRDMTFEPGDGPSCGPHTLCTNRGNTRPVLDALLHPPTSQWAVSLAISGQRHVIPSAHLTAGDGWTVYMEGMPVHGTSAQFAALLTPIATLKAAGFTDTELTTGDVSSQRITLDALTIWRTHYPALAPHATSPLAALAMWCLTKETINEYAV